MSNLCVRKDRIWADLDRTLFYATDCKRPVGEATRGTRKLTTLHRVHAVSVWATVVPVLLLPASLAPSFLRLVRPAMPRE